MTFRFQGRYALLTYAQCGDLSGFDVCSHISGLAGECIVGEEAHADGGRHLHVFVHWERQFRCRRPDVFDVGGRHPNIVGNIRDPGAAWDYVIKEGCVIAGGLLDRPGRARASKTSHMWHDIVDADDMDEFLGRVRELDPEALCKSYPALRAYGDYAYAPAPEPYVSPAGLEFTSGAISDLVGWATQNLGAPRGECWRSPPDVGGTVRG